MRPMDVEESQELLRTSQLGILAMAEESNAYAIPIYFAFDGDHVWMHCHPGLKDHYIESTKESCLTVIHVGSANLWESVQAFGSIEKATLSSDIEAAQAALAHVPFPPAEGNYPRGLPVRSDRDVYYLKLTPTHVEGKKSAFTETAARAD